MGPPLTPLIRPRQFFANRSRTARLAGVGVWGLFVIIMAVFGHLYLKQFIASVEQPPPNLEEMARNQMLEAIVQNTILSGIALVIVAGIMHYFASAVATDRSLKDAIGITGWAFAPLVVAFALVHAVIIRQLRATTMAGSDMEQVAPEYVSVAGEVFAMLGPVWFAGLAWSVYVLAFGFAGAYDVPLKETAYPATAIGVGCILLYAF